jgi:hypothetical protein
VFLGLSPGMRQTSSQHNVGSVGLLGSETNLIAYVIGGVGGRCVLVARVVVIACCIARRRARSAPAHASTVALQSTPSDMASARADAFAHDASQREYTSFNVGVTPPAAAVPPTCVCVRICAVP